MTNTRIIFDNFTRDATILTGFTEHPQFPVDNLQDDAIELPWRSRYGAGTGNGVFWVQAGVNDKINFDEGGAELTATLTAGTYDGQTLAVEIKTQLDAAGALTYTVTYSETTGKFTIAASGNFTLRWNTGTNKAVDASGLLGFSDAANDTGAATYDSDTVVIHSYAQVKFDLSEAREYNAVAVMGHNLTSAASIKLQGADDDAFTANLVEDTLTYNANNIFAFLSTARIKRYTRLIVIDAANPSMYIEIGTLVVGKYVELSRPPVGQQVGPTDQTEMERAPSGMRISTQDLDPLNLWRLPFKGLSDADALAIRQGLAVVGVKYNVIFCLDSTAPNTNSYWVNFAELAQPDRAFAHSWTWEAILEEVL